ncbi:hypothetical protein BKA80DRAFT_73971 [Phyllosticta citrichinensis]
MLSLKLSLATVLATASAVSLDNLQTDATLHDYMVYQSGVADSNPPWCEVPYSSLDLSSVTAYGGVTKNTCGSCIQVCGSVGCKHLLVIDQCSRPDGQLDISTGAGQQVCGATTGHCQVSVKSAGAQNCAHIWDGRMFYDYTPLYGGFSELKKYVDGKGGAAGAAAASSAPASSSVETSAPAPTSFVLPTSSVVPPTTSSVVLSSSPAPVESSSPAPVFTPSTTASTPLQVETTPAVVSSTPVYTPPVIVPPFPFKNSTSPAPSLPSATVAAQGTGNVCPFRVTKTVTPTTTFFVTASSTPTPIASPPTEEPEEEVEPQSNQEPESAPAPEEVQGTEPGQEQQQQPQSSSPELTTTNTLRATQTLQFFTTLTTRVVAVQSVTAPTAPTGVPLSTGTPGRQAFQGQGWNSTSSGAGSGSGHERRSEHLRGHLARGGSVRRGIHERSDGCKKEASI